MRFKLALLVRAFRCDGSSMVTNMHGWGIFFVPLTSERQQFLWCDWSVAKHGLRRGRAVAYGGGCRGCERIGHGILHAPGIAFVCSRRHCTRVLTQAEAKRELEEAVAKGMEELKEQEEADGGEESKPKKRTKIVKRKKKKKKTSSSGGSDGEL